ncbi:hypothetical protein CU666_21175 [Pseudomonas syringae pv. actinidifoliorum]|nr:hypothetical protein [Pseudomonas syringae pv. actinidifoliorum]
MSELVRDGLRSGPKPATLVVSGAPRQLVSLPVPGSSRTSEASPGPHTYRASARRAWERTCSRRLRFRRPNSCDCTGHLNYHARLANSAGYPLA